MGTGLTIQPSITEGIIDAGGGTSTLTNSHIFVGNASNVATDVAMSGDATIDNTGLLTIANNAVSNAKFRQSGATSLVGRSANSTGNVADISTGAVADVVMRASTTGTTIGWGQVNIASNNAVTGVLRIVNGGTSFSTFATGDIMYASATNTLSKLSGNALTSRKALFSSGNGATNTTTQLDYVRSADILPNADPTWIVYVSQTGSIYSGDQYLTWDEINHNFNVGYTNTFAVSDGDNGIFASSPNLVSFGDPYNLYSLAKVKVDVTNNQVYSEAGNGQCYVGDGEFNGNGTYLVVDDASLQYQLTNLNYAGVSQGITIADDNILGTCSRTGLKLYNNPGNITLDGGQVGFMFTNNGAGTGTELTLQDPTEDYVYGMTVLDADLMTFINSGSNPIYWNGETINPGGKIESDIVGSVIVIQCFKTNYYNILYSEGQWTVVPN